MFFHNMPLGAIDALMILNLIIVIANAVASFLGAKKGSSSK